eukprot:6707005-Prymnesium_polylepis.1
MEDSWPAGTRGRALWLLAVTTWLLLFTPAWPLLELMLRPARLTNFFFYYPKAAGCGMYAAGTRTLTVGSTPF